ncbi:MAG: DUF4956 domain-containing protein [Bacteroidota bacterium]
MTTKPFITLILFLLLLMPMPYSCSAQKMEEDPSETEIVQSETDTLTGKEVKGEKKKKNVVMLDEHFFISLGINLAAILLIILLIYYPNYKKMDYIFTFIIFNLVIFLLTFVLKYIKLSMGAAFGLFAVFSMLRYRTAGLSIRDMTYLFIFIAIGLISAIQLDFYKLIIIHGIVLSGTYILDGNLFFKREHCQRIQYEKIELIRPDRKQELMNDLVSRTGLKITRISIGRIDFLRDTASIKVYYYE